MQRINGELGRLGRSLGRSCSGWVGELRVDEAFGKTEESSSFSVIKPGREKASFQFPSGGPTSLRIVRSAPIWQATKANLGTGSVRQIKVI